MKAVTFDVTVPRYLLGKALGGVTDRVFWGRLSGVSFGSLPDPVLPGEDWVLLDVILAGICGSDLEALTFSGGFSTVASASFPAVPGHEILARVRETGTAVSGLDPGQRVVVDPRIAGVEIGDTPLASGAFIGYHRDLPGGWAERMVAHRSQLFPVSDVLDDRLAVLIEPLSIGMHAVLGAGDVAIGPEQPVLVMGSGPIALGTVWALRATGVRGPVAVQGEAPHERTLARRLGASGFLAPETRLGKGFPLIFDCVGSASSLGRAADIASPRGKIVLLGCPATMPDPDLTLGWDRELEIQGFVGYGRERFRGEELHTFRITHDLLLETPAPVQEMVTHVFPLDQYRNALAAASHPRKSGAVKVLLKP